MELDTCVNTTGHTFIHCMSEAAYSTDDIIWEDLKYLEPKIQTTPFLISYWDGIAQSLILDRDVMSHNILKSLILNLNHNLSYIIYITDPKLQFVLGTPETFPRSIFTLEQRTGITWVYLKVNFNQFCQSATQRLCYDFLSSGNTT